MDLPAFSCLDGSKPQAFYLGADEEFAGLADASIISQDGHNLPVHLHILSLHSRVLKSLFAAVHEGRGGTVSSGACVGRVAQ